jgi:hypothetical protein
MCQNRTYHSKELKMHQEEKIIELTKDYIQNLFKTSLNNQPLSTIVNKAIPHLYKMQLEIDKILHNQTDYVK